MKKVLLIIPAYNEQDNIVKVIDEVNKFKYDYVVVNDCSTDNTLEVLEENNINHINLPINLGLFGAVQTGMLYAANKDYDVVIQIDGDGQHDISYVEKLVERIENGVSIACGSRFLEKREFDHSFTKRVSQGWIVAWIKLLSGLKLTDPTSGMRAYEKEVYSIMMNSANFRPEPETLMVFSKNGYKVEEVQVDMREREAGESYLTPVNALKYMLETTLSIFNLATIKLDKGEK